MSKKWSKSWKSSKKQNKQRKYRYNAPLHIRQKFMRAKLSKELREKYDVTRATIRVGDKVKLMRGQFKGFEDDVKKVDLKNEKIYLENLTTEAQDGTDSAFPVHPSNVMITKLDLNDDRRLKRKID